MRHKIPSTLIICTLLIAGLFSGCYYDNVIPDVSVYSGDEVTFSDQIIPIFSESCNFSGCHNTGEEEPDLSVNNAYNALINGNYINVGQPEQSELYRWVNGSKSTPMPVNGTDPKIASAILLWIQQGGQNN